MLYEIDEAKKNNITILLIAVSRIDEIVSQRFIR